MRKAIPIFILILLSLFVMICEVCKVQETIFYYLKAKKTFSILLTCFFLLIIDNVFIQRFFNYTKDQQIGKMFSEIFALPRD